jgi:hypothetical protein
MSTVFVIDAAKLRQARGPRTRRQVVEAAGNKFSEQQLYGWEKGEFRPRPEVVPALLKGLNVSFDQIASPLLP